MTSASGLAAAAAKRLEERRTGQRGPLAAAQKALWDALIHGNIDEALRQAGIVECIRGPQAPSPLALKVIERFNRIATREQEHQGAFVMKRALETARSRLTRLATTRLLSAGPQACEQLEHQAVVAIEKSDWRAARMALHLRLKMRCAPTAKECAQIERILKLIDQAEQQGIGPEP